MPLTILTACTSRAWGGMEMSLVQTSVRLRARARGGADVRSRFAHRGAQHPPQMPLVEHDHVVHALPPDRSHHPLDVTVLPGRLGPSGAAVAYK